MNAKWLVVLAAVIGVFGWMTMTSYAAAPAAKAVAGQARQPLLTEEQRAAVKDILTTAHSEIKPLREAVKAEVEKLIGLRKDQAGEDAIKAQVAVVKEKVAALKARIEQLKADLKAAVPAEVYTKILQRMQERKQQFLQNHPRLAEFIAKHQAQTAK